MVNSQVIPLAGQDFPFQPDEFYLDSYILRMLRQIKKKQIPHKISTLIHV